MFNGLSRVPHYGNRKVLSSSLFTHHIVPFQANLDRNVVGKTYSLD